MKIKIPAGTQITVNKPTPYGITPFNIITKKELNVDVTWIGVNKYFFKFSTYNYAASVEKYKGGDLTDKQIYLE